jgi:hypothetical protein
MSFTKHGQKTRSGPSSEYASWSSMIQRCTNPKNAAWVNYGGRGILVCERWRKFEEFFKDMGNRPGKGFDLDRIDNEKGYEPSNCRWVSRKSNLNNRRASFLICIDGVTKTAAEWAEIAGLERHLVGNRYKRGWRGQKLLKKSQKTKSIASAGGIAGVCRSVDDVAKLLEGT